MVFNPAPRLRLERTKSVGSGDTCARRRSAGGGQGGSGYFLAGSARLYRRIAERVAPNLLFLRIAVLAVAGPAIAIAVTMLAASDPIAIMLVTGLVLSAYAAAMIDIADLIDRNRSADRITEIFSDISTTTVSRNSQLEKRNMFLVEKCKDLRNHTRELKADNAYLLEIINSSAAGEGGGDAPRSDREVQRVPAADAENVFPFGPKGVA